MATPLTPGVAGFVSRAEKSALVVDLSRSRAKCGFAGEARPRAIVASGAAISAVSAAWQTQASEEQWLAATLALFREIYFVRLHTKPKERRALVVLPEQAPSRLAWACAKALLEFFHAPSALVVPRSAVALFATGLTSGIVVALGEAEADVVGIAHGAVLQPSAQCVRLDEEMLAHPGIAAGSEPDAEATALEPGSLAAALASCVASCPLHVRPVVVQNIVVCGDRAAEVRGLLEAARSTTLEKARPSLVSRARLCVRAGAPWVGGSVAASLETFAARSATAEQFRKHPYAFDATSLLWGSLDLRREAEAALDFLHRGAMASLGATPSPAALRKALKGGAADRQLPQRRRAPGEQEELLLPHDVEQAAAEEERERAMVRQREVTAPETSWGRRDQGSDKEEGEEEEEERPR